MGSMVSQSLSQRRTIPALYIKGFFQSNFMWIKQYGFYPLILGSILPRLNNRFSYQEMLCYYFAFLYILIHFITPLMTPLFTWLNSSFHLEFMLCTLQVFLPTWLLFSKTQKKTTVIPLKAPATILVPRNSLQYLIIFWIMYPELTHIPRMITTQAYRRKSRYICI